MATAKKSDCFGCRNDMYNYPNSVSSSGQCWNFEDAKLHKVNMISVRDRPPWAVEKGSLRPTCYHKDGFVFVSPEKTC